MRDKNDKTNDKRGTIEFELFLAFYVPGRNKIEEIIAYFKWTRDRKSFTGYSLFKLSLIKPKNIHDIIQPQLSTL